MHRFFFLFYFVISNSESLQECNYFTWIASCNGHRSQHIIKRRCTWRRKHQKLLFRFYWYLYKSERTDTLRECVIWIQQLKAPSSSTIDREKHSFLLTCSPFSWEECKNGRKKVFNSLDCWLQFLFRLMYHLKLYESSRNAPTFENNCISFFSFAQSVDHPSSVGVTQTPINVFAFDN